MKPPTALRPRYGKASALAWIFGILISAISPCAVAHRAILIGVSHFDHLPIKPLEGPPNDVALLASALQSLGMRQQNIIQITDAADVDFLPRRANILRVLSEQARLSKRGETVVVYFSGHGAQVPQSLPVAKGGWVEPDGLDEVFLTRDTKSWDKQRHRVEGALLDDEIGDALAAFTKKGVRVWSIFDTCHAGDMARTIPYGTGEPIWRGVDPSELGVPIDAVPLQAKQGRRLINKNTRLVGVSHRPVSGPLVTFYASQPDEASPEELYRYPDAVSFWKNDKSHGRFGVFTWELVTALAANPRTYSELVKMISNKYQTRPFPTPGFEGNLSRRLF
ncbi:MAG: caspase family protein [Aeromicrobium sp.]|nr:caspase family protein [Burkholderiales bacterium]